MPMIDHASLRRDVEALPEGASVPLDKATLLGLVRDLELGATARAVLAGRSEPHVALQMIRREPYSALQQVRP
jgi:hypothetical protein